MIARWHSALCIALAALSLVSLSSAQTATVRGRTDRYDPPDIVTASNVDVTLYQGDTRIGTTTTSQDGMYYFLEVPVGACRIEISPPPGRSRLRPFRVSFRIPQGRPTVDVPAQLLNRFTFEEPAENASVPTDSVAPASGTHSFPTGTIVWFLFKTESEVLHFWGDRTRLTAGQPWSKDLRAPPEATDFLAVLATGEAGNYFGDMVEQESFGELSELPEGARVLATRRLSP